jgi:tellurite resistance protein TerC
MEFTYEFWIGFLVIVGLALSFDLGVFNKRDRVLAFKEAATMTTCWVLLASLFCSFIYFAAGKQKALEYLTGYVVELTLSVDNVFVFVLIFSYFKVPKELQHRVLFWGIIGAIVMRFVMITGGIYLFSNFDWVFYIFGAFLIYSGIKIAFAKDDKDAAMSLEGNSVMKFLRSKFKITDDFVGNKFVVKIGNRYYITPLMVVLILVEKTDLIFALDSIPAILAITQDSFIVFTSNIFAILGLRSLYFLLANLMNRFIYLKFGIAIILSFIGVKMILAVNDIHMPIQYSLLVILTVLATSVMFSLLVTAKANEKRY